MVSATSLGRHSKALSSDVTVHGGGLEGRQPLQEHLFSEGWSWLRHDHPSEKMILGGLTAPVAPAGGIPLNDYLPTSLAKMKAESDK